MTETRPDACSIPDGGISVKALLRDAVNSAPVRIHKCGLSVSAEATDDERLQLLLRLVDGESQVVCPFRLCIGDVWNQTPERSEARKHLALSLRERLGENYYSAIRRYGWVAGMWPQHLRGGKRNWSSYLKGPKGQGVKPTKKPLVHEWVRREVVEDGEVLHCEHADGAAYTVRVVQKRVAVCGDTGGTQGDA